MAYVLLAPGPPPLTEDAADAALDAMDFIAATIRGIHSIDVTPTMRALWRKHIAFWYPYLPPWTRGWYANAPFLMTMLRTQWPLLPPAQQAPILEGWAAALPEMLQMLDPVLRQTNDQLNQAVLPDVQAMRDRATQQKQAEADPELSAVKEASEHSVHSETLRVGSIMMTNATIDLMKAMSR